MIKTVKQSTGEKWREPWKKKHLKVVIVKKIKKKQYLEDGCQKSVKKKKEKGFQNVNSERVECANWTDERIRESDAQELKKKKQRIIDLLINKKKIDRRNLEGMQWNNVGKKNKKTKKKKKKTKGQIN